MKIYLQYSLDYQSMKNDKMRRSDSDLFPCEMVVRAVLWRRRIGQVVGRVRLRVAGEAREGRIRAFRAQRAPVPYKTERQVGRGIG